jgi:hypothetical protein
VKSELQGIEASKSLFALREKASEVPIAALQSYQGVYQVLYK